jgi:uncharacterized protein with von Willebrand factor type A (vWA) domain
MREVTLRFIGDLRAAGLRISVGESMDAVRAVAAVGIERDLLREALAASLVKDEEDRPVFDEIFARFFAGPRSSRKGKPQDPTNTGHGQRLKANGVQSRPQVRPPEQRRADERSTQEHPEQARKYEPVHSRESSTARRSEGAQTVQPEEHEEGPQTRLAGCKALLEKPFKAFDPRDIEVAKELVEDLSRRLRGRLSRRYRRSKHGRLDFRRTIRASITHGGVPIDLLLRGRRPGKPDLVAFCDLSGSVALVSDFLLALLAPAAAYFRRVRTFAYVDRLCEVSFEQGYVVPHAALDLYARSDFGKVLQHFWQEGGERLLTRHTLVVILGDARNNRRPPRPDLLARLRGEAKKLVWLNPEPRERWNTGDSVIGLYAPVCDAVLECGNLRQLLDALQQAV